MASPFCRVLQGKGKGKITEPEQAWTLKTTWREYPNPEIIKSIYCLRAE